MDETSPQPVMATTEDYVEYRIYISPSETIQDLSVWCTLLNEFAKGCAKEYIWQDEKFLLRPRSEGQGHPAHLIGRTHFGENIEDEWAIAHLIFEITKKFQSLTATLVDNDGQFLLIEAAHALPKWVKPETCENRVFIKNGKVHVIPMPRTPADVTFLPPPGSLDVSTALKLLHSTELGLQTLAAQEVQMIIKEKINEFPEKFTSNLHRVRCLLPPSVARMLQKDPQLVAHAVRAFYYRDPLSLKVCATMPRFHPTSLVSQRVTFSRCLYAMLSQQQFHPPKGVFGPSPPTPSHPEYKAFHLGVKLACGFEMMYHNSKRTEPMAQQEEGDDETITLASVRDTPKWIAFRTSLSQKGFFKGELEGSQEYKRLESQAFEFFKDSVLTSKSSTQGTEEDEFTSTPLWKHLDDLTKQIERESSEGTSTSGAMPQETQKETHPADDSEDWLFITPQDVDDLILKREKRNEEFSNGGVDLDVEEDDESDLGDMNSSEEEDEDEEDFEGVFGGTQKQKRKTAEVHSTAKKTVDEKKPETPILEDGPDEEQQKEMEQMVGTVKDFVEKISSFEGAEFDESEEEEGSDMDEEEEKPSKPQQKKSLEEMDDADFVRAFEAALGLRPTSGSEGDASKSAFESGHDMDEDLREILGIQERKEEKEQQKKQEAGDKAEGPKKQEASSSSQKTKVQFSDQKEQQKTTKTEESKKTEPAKAGKSKLFEKQVEDMSDAEIEGLSLDDYMALMDRELKRSRDAEFFENLYKSGGGGGGASASKPSGSKQPQKEESSESEEEEEEEEPSDEEFDQGDIDVNLLQNFLQSYASQEGMPGPVGNLLSQLMNKGKK